MQHIKFANVLLESNPRSLSYPALYCRSTGPVVFERTQKVWEMYGPGTFDFTTYFNSLSIMKLQRYTVAKCYYLHLELRGAACKVVQTMADSFSIDSVEVEGASFDLPASDGWLELDFPLLIDPRAVVTGFKVEAEGSVFIRNSYYYVDVEVADLNDVELALSTTTFKKEDFIVPNIELVREQIMKGEPEMAEHFKMLVIDNGRTLDAEALSGDGITVFPNPNAGGAGGFTRGMIEAQRLPVPATHVLLMDDDVAVSPESIKRTYNLLRIVNDDYATAMVSGAMLNMEVGEDLWEDTGYMTPEGTFCPAKPPLRLTKFEDVVFNETFRVPGEIKKLHQRYAAWWYCAIPIATIKQQGLPLPVFVRCDDAEYGVRCAPEFMTMNGICIWHDSFHNRYNAAVERYQTTRNTLIAQATTGFSPNSDFLHELRRNVRLELKKFGYENAELCLDAFEDFMKGPDFIATKGMAEKTFMDANKHKEKLVPFAEVERQAKELGLDFEIAKVDRQLIDGDKPRSLPERLNDLATDNGQRMFVTEGEGYAVIPNIGWAYPAGAIRGKKYLIVLDWYNRTGAIRVKDPKRYDEIQRRFKDDLKQYKANIQALRERYGAARERLTSVEFWKDYLGM